MKKAIWISLLTAALVLIPTQAGARSTATNDGNEWLKACDAGTHGQEMWCIGYTQAMSHTATMLSLMVDTQYFCTNGRTVTMGQIRDIMKNYLYRNPAKRSDFMMLVYIEAMQEAFPC